jgi:cyanophycinase
MASPSLLASLAVSLALVAPAFPGERLVAVGGGDRPPQAMARFVAWAGGEQARILVVLWATSEPAESLKALWEDLAPHRPGQVEAAPLAPLAGDGRARVLEQLARATGVFFSGGDQGRIMDVLADAELLRAFRERYAQGVVFGGTSAGTAVMSDPMITGDGDFTVIDGEKVGVRAGLGLLPGAILDQHFVKRQRENRLLGLILKHPDLLGLGVDEATALLVTDNRLAEVVGSSQVIVVDGKVGRGSLLLHLLGPGEGFDLERRVRVPVVATPDPAGGR